MKLCYNGMLDCAKYSVLRILFDIINCGHQESRYYLILTLKLP